LLIVVSESLRVPIVEVQKHGVVEVSLLQLIQFIGFAPFHCGSE
jgi:hypothetical protein